MKDKPQLSLPMGQSVINSMRDRLGRSSVDSRYAKLSNHQKTILLLAASINPNLHIEVPFSEFSREQREDIRRALIDINDLGSRFSGLGLSKEQFQSRSITQIRSAQNDESSELEDINQLIAKLMREMKTQNKY